MTTKHHPRTQFGLSYYLSAIRLLIDGVRAGLTHAKLARLLNDSQLPAPSGSRWTPTSIKLCLHKIRHPDTFPSRMYQNMTRLVFIGMLDRADAQVLTAHRGFTEVLI